MTPATVYAKKMTCLLQKPLLLLHHISATTKPPEDTNAAAEYSMAKLHSISETYVCTNPGLFARNLLLLRKSPPIPRRRFLICFAAVTQMHVRKTIQK